MVSKNADNFFLQPFNVFSMSTKFGGLKICQSGDMNFQKAALERPWGLFQAYREVMQPPNTCQKMLLGGSEEITWLFWVHSSFLEAFACIQCTVGSFLWSGIWNTHLCYDWYPRRTLAGISFVNFITFSWFLLHLIEQTTFYNCAEYLFKRRDTFKDMGHSGSLHPPIMNS